MNIRPFTLDEANEIREDFEDMTDTEFRYGADIVIVDNVVINATGATDIQNAGQGYDVVLACTKASGDASESVYISIRDYVQLNGVNYNFP